MSSLGTPQVPQRTGFQPQAQRFTNPCGHWTEQSAAHLFFGGLEITIAMD